MLAQKANWFQYFHDLDTEHDIDSYLTILSQEKKSFQFDIGRA